MNQSISHRDSPYERLLYLSQLVAPQRPIFPSLLNAAALALRYDRPGEAYLPLLEILLAESPDNVHARAKMVANSLPFIGDAGAILGTGVKVRPTFESKSEQKFVGYYGMPMQKLANGSWRVDELDLLTEPKALGTIHPTELTWGLVTRDSVRGPKVLNIDVSTRKLLASDLLPNGPSIASLRKNFKSESRGATIQLARNMLGYS